MAILYGNTNRFDPSAPVIRSARERSASTSTEDGKSEISPSCVVENFPSIAIYRIESENKNVILKYQSNGIIDVRKGTTAKLGKSAHSILKTIFSSQEKIDASCLDMSTNIDNIVILYAAGV